MISSKIFKEKDSSGEFRRCKIIVLGAGASIGAKRIHNNNPEYWLTQFKMPGAKSFFTDLAKIPYKKPNHKYISSFPFLHERAYEFTRMAWQIPNTYFDPNEWKNVNIEDLLTFIDIGNKLYTKNSTYHKMFKCVRRDILDYISLEIASRSDDQRCEHLIQLFQTLTGQDVILSFNWDTIAESSLEFMDHSLSKSYLKITKTFNFGVNEFDKSGIFLKLHGSINWKFCSNKKCSKKNKIFLSKNFLTENCSCGERLETLIIPPTSNKDIIHKDSFFNKMWRVAANKVTEADEIIFIGYSFPTADYYSDWLFRQVNFAKNREMKIIIINPEAVAKNSVLRKKCQNLFRGLRIEIYETLERFLEARSVCENLA